VKRVGFVFPFSSDAWLGGVNYFRNLLTAIYDLPNRRIEPVIILSPDVPLDLLKGFPPFERVNSTLVNPGQLRWKARRALQIYAGWDFLFETFLKTQRIDLLSHSGHLGRFCPIPTLPWIPDFQELHLPEYFSDKEIATRTRNAGEACQHASAVLFSSQSAADDFVRSNGKCLAAVEILPFVAAVPPPEAIAPRDEIEARYGFRGHYYFLPNQFWAHKNHAVVLNALASLKAQGCRPLVLACGNPNDHRQPDHYAALMRQVKELGIGDGFRSLGLVPYKDIMTLMRWSVAVINPSLFEGWSTTVEEAKSMGKAVIVSDIPTHREQSPARAKYFPPHSPDRLAALLMEAWQDFDEVADRASVKVAALQLADRRRSFATRYEDIVLRIC
jgi:glycosyltransferase involved in cell wall biosynthesis